MKRSQVYWLCQVLGWSAHGMVNATFASLSGVPLSRSAAIAVWGAGGAILCSHVFRGWIRRRGWLKLSLLHMKMAGNTQPNPLARSAAIPNTTGA